ncbi:MAG TPA: hypothetical protein ENH45_01310 [Nitrospirae bacterium]|nr:putative transmembrane protein [bacterium BMS3Abin09]GBE40576.1 putative transmembrane protein [bacterium BMS3Bbin09]HDH34916.1 hypothetical protein [Nitrospirota bacterium]HDZ83832.1 hypothetical protein [Nitrospirota bacterium]
MRMFKRICLFNLVAACFLIMFFSSSAFSITFEVSPAQISVDSLYHGSKVVVTGEVEAGEDIIIKFSSPEKKAHLRKKGKRGGLLWMNVGEFEFNPVSDVYLLYSTQDISSMLTKDQQDKYALGYDAFKRIVEVSPVSSESEKEKWVEEFIKFKENTGVYGHFTDQVETETNGGKKTFRLSLDWPYQAPPQEYTVSVYAVKDNAVQNYNQMSLNVKKVGALNFISDLAFNKASIYGIVSIFIALLAGFIVSVIFKGGSGAH